MHYVVQNGEITDCLASKIIDPLATSATGILTV